ncbi:MAG: DUF1415 domain-containing protein [Saprospiraceae bacterium]|nr:DUF1415 domain-containing protein [Saprospiraceae bacterium]
MTNVLIEKTVRNWVETVVIGLNLCPFAKKPLVKNSVRFIVSEADSEEKLLVDLWKEIEHIRDHPEMETTLLIHPMVLSDFSAFNDFLQLTDELLRQMDLEGVFQIASFHPDYQFEGTKSEDVENYTNRSPYPILHILREESLDIAIDKYPDTDQIPPRNIKLMREMGTEKINELLRKCFS